MINLTMDIIFYLYHFILSLTSPDLPLSTLTLPSCFSSWTFRRFWACSSVCTCPVWDVASSTLQTDHIANLIDIIKCVLYMMTNMHDCGCELHLGMGLRGGLLCNVCRCELHLDMGPRGGLWYNGCGCELHLGMGPRRDLWYNGCGCELHQGKGQRGDLWYNGCRCELHLGRGLRGDLWYNGCRCELHLGRGQMGRFVV